MRFRLGCVPYVNARPLVHWFETNPSLGVEVVYDVPSRLPAMLLSGAADAVLASSFDALANPDRRAAANVSISSLAKAESVRLFSRRPLGEIASLAFDASSLTSNHLALVLLRERYGVSPITMTRPPDLQAMLAEADACVLIGDIGMRTVGEGLFVLDLGEAWTAHTGLPFVWALWIGQQGLTPKLAGLLQQAPLEAQATFDQVVNEAALRSGWPEELCRRYLSDVMNYELTDRHRQGLATYAEKMASMGLIDQMRTPEWVEGQ